MGKKWKQRIQFGGYSVVKKLYEHEHEIYWGVEPTEDGKEMNEFSAGEG